MIERAQHLAFAGGLSVFPGGRVDQDDIELATQLHADRIAEAAARIAAIRETLEEAGLAICFAPQPSVEQLQRLREGLLGGRSFAELLEEHGLGLDLDGLLPWARWQPAHTHKRRFDTRFYLAVTTGDTSHAIINAAESTRLMWGTPEVLLGEADAGRLALMYPTRRNLERLAPLSSVAAAKADALAIPVRPITPWFEDRDGGIHLCIPNDAGYPVTSQEFSALDRG